MSGSKQFSLDFKRKRQLVRACRTIIKDNVKWNRDMVINCQDVQETILRPFLVSILSCCGLEKSLDNNFVYVRFTTFNNNFHINVWISTEVQIHVETDLLQKVAMEFKLEQFFNEAMTSLNEKELEVQELMKTNSALEDDKKENNNLIKELKIRFYQENNQLLEQNRSLERKLIEIAKTNERLKVELQETIKVYEMLKVEHEETLLDLGKLSVERAANINETKKAKIFETIFPSKVSSASIVVHDEIGDASTSISSTNGIGQVPNRPQDGQHFGQAESNCQFHVSSTTSNPESVLIATEYRNRPSEHLAYSVEQEEPRERDPISLGNEPQSSVTANVFYTYKLLLITLCHRLLFCDIVKLKNWANEQFSVETNLGAVEVVFQLDRKGAINAMDLSLLIAFFESILRYDLVLLIETFCSGDYVGLKRMISMTNSRNRSRNPPRAANFSAERSIRVPLPNGNDDSNSSNVRVSEMTSTSDDGNVTCNVSNDNVRENSSTITKSIPNCVRGTITSVRTNCEVVADGPIVHNRTVCSSNSNASSETPTAAETNRNGMSKSTKPSSKSRMNRNNHTCNGHSQSQPHDHFNRSKNYDGEEEKWLCSHYKRRCFVKFECCDKFWPCHRCHNSESTCGRNKLKSRDTTMVKCNECGKEQQFGENGQFCVQCNTQFADFYCGQCKHLTGMDDHPYHCDKCGICRIHGDRSFHCDICGVCLDVQLRGNHKCRADSAHDECCICLEDAFTGCQILPCSHKVHKNCATRMIQSGITRCPICRQSFAHKLERRPIPKRIIRKR